MFKNKTFLILRNKMFYKLKQMLFENRYRYVNFFLIIVGIIECERASPI